MERMTRMSKYKELRESLKNDVVTAEETKAYVPNQEIVKDANYYRNLVGDDSTVEKQVEIKKPANEDTLYESLTFDTIKENETEEVKSVLGKVRENNGQEEFNTRMDILNKIRQSKVEKEIVEEYREEVEEVIEDIEEEIEEPIIDDVNRFGYSKEKEVDIVIEETEEEDDEEETPHKRFGLFKRKSEDDEEEIEEDEDDEDEEEGSSFMIKLLNGCIIILVLVLIGLVAFIAKEILL